MNEKENRRTGNGSRAKQRREWEYLPFLFSVILLVLWLAGCSDGSETGTAGGETETATTAITAAVEPASTTAATQASDQQTVRLTEDCSYEVPKEFTETKEVFAENQSDGKCFVNKDASRKIRSWVDHTGFVYPEDIFSIADEGDDVEVGDGSMINMSPSTIKGTKEENGSVIYRTLIIVDCGIDCSSFIEIESLHEADEDLESEIRRSIKTGDEEDGGQPEYYGPVPHGPSDEEIDRALMKEVEDSYHEDMQEQLRREEENFYR